MSFIATPLGYILLFLYNIIQNYGITIIVFTIIIKTALLPLTIGQLRQSKQMADFTPKMNELKKKYGHDRAKLNEKTIELQREMGVNPLKGCLPLLIQMPILIGLIRVLQYPAKYISDPALNEAVKESFLWVQRLDQPDSIHVSFLPFGIPLLPILAGLATFVSFSLNSSSSAGGMNQTTMRMMKYLFPVMIIWFGLKLPAGVILYWFISTTYQAIQQFILKKKTDKEEALKAEQLELEKKIKKEEAAAKKAEEKEKNKGKKNNNKKTTKKED